MTHGGAHPSPCQTTAEFLQLAESPWSRTRGRWAWSETSSALAGNLLQGFSPSDAVLTSPLTWFSTPAEARSRGVALGDISRYIGSWTYRAVIYWAADISGRDTLGSGHIEPWIYWAVDISGRGYTGQWAHRVVDILGSGYIGPWIYWAVDIVSWIHRDIVRLAMDKPGNGHIGPWKQRTVDTLDWFNKHSKQNCVGEFETPNKKDGLQLEKLLLGSLA